jgi:hypothetical protein
VRLGTCIALEVALAAGTLGTLVFVGSRTADVAGAYLTAHEAAAATSATTESVRSFEPLPAAELHVAPPKLPGTTSIFGAPDDVLLAPLGASPVTQVKINHGGTSLSLRLDFATGARAAFKPQQIHPQSDPKREIAAYRIDRMLGIGHVPPAKPIALAVDDLVAAAEPAFRTYTAGRIANEAIAHDGIVRGEVSWWIPEIRDMMLGGIRVDDSAGMDLWTSYLTVGTKIPADMQPIVSQLASCVLFDVLIDNADRWTGNNTKGSPDRKTLYFMDNTLSFSIYTWGHAANLDPLRKISVFPKKVVDKLRALTYADIAAAMEITGDDAAFGPLIEPAEIRAMLARRDHEIEYIDALIAEYGEKAVLALP